MANDKYKLLYWPGIPGRVEPVRLSFIEAGVAYEDKGDFMSLLSRSGSKSSGKATHFAPPILEHGDTQISQTPNIMLYIGPKLGLLPEDDLDKFKVNEYFLTLSDFQNEVHDTHHPIAAMKYYEDQKDAALERAKDFREGRIPLYMDHFEAILNANKASDGKWLVGDKITYADIMLFHVVDGLKFAFPRASAVQLAKNPKVVALYESVKERPNIKAYLASERRLPFSNGVYRHYDELDSPA